MLGGVWKFGIAFGEGDQLRSIIQGLAVAVLALLTLVLAIDSTLAHGGGLDSRGCHSERGTGDYHCHRPPRPLECLTEAAAGPDGAHMYFSPEVANRGYWWSAPAGAGLRLTGGDARGWCEVVNGGWVQISDLRADVAPASFVTPPPWRPRIAPAPAPAPPSAPHCALGQAPEFLFGFAFLKSLLGDRMGRPLECEHANPENGDTLQQTTTGLSFYRKRTNTPTFTDGWNHWAWTVDGLVTWTGHSIDPPGR